MVIGQTHVKQNIYNGNGNSTYSPVQKAAPTPSTQGNNRTSQMTPTEYQRSLLPPSWQQNVTLQQHDPLQQYYNQTEPKSIQENNRTSQITPNEHQTFPLPPSWQQQNTTLQVQDPQQQYYNHTSSTLHSFPHISKEMINKEQPVYQMIQVR